MFRSSLLQVVNFQSGGKLDIKKRGKRRKMFLKSTYSFFLFFLLWSGSGTSRKVVSALNSRADFTSRLITVSMCFLWSLLSSLSRFTEILSFFYLSPPAPNSSLHNPSHFWRDRFPLATSIFIIFLFSDFYPDGCVEPMRGDAFIHFVCGSRRVNIRLGVLLLIPTNYYHKNWNNNSEPYDCLQIICIR